MVSNIFLGCNSDSKQTSLNGSDLTKIESLSAEILKLKHELTTAKAQLESCRLKLGAQTAISGEEHSLVQGNIYAFDRILELRSKDGTHIETHSGQKLLLNPESVFSVQEIDFWDGKAIYYVTVLVKDTNATIRFGKYIPNKIIFESDLDIGSVRSATDYEKETYYNIPN